MKKLLVLSIFVSLLLASCGSVNFTPQQQAELASKIENQQYTFKPQSANPMGGKAISLSGDFSLKISKDTIDSYLPYYGRAYSINPMEGGGIKFISKNFDYKLAPQKSGMWNVEIVTKDTRSQIKMRLQLGNTGYATLTVEDMNRQSISFYGTIE